MKLTQNNLLVILALIILTKFAVFPLIDWQDETLVQLNSLNKKIAKSENHINNFAQLESDQKKLRDYLASLKNDIDTYQDISTYQIAKQKEVETLFNESTLAIKSFNWQDSIETGSGAQLKLMIQYSGLLKDFLNFHLKISQFNQSVEITNLGLNIRGQEGGSMGVITGSIVFVFRPLEEAQSNGN